MPKIDIHTHILPEKLPSFKDKFGYGGFITLQEGSRPGFKNMVGDDGKFFREVECNCWDPQVRLKECEEAAVDVQVLSTVPVMFSYWTQPQDGLAVAQFLNDHLAEVVESDPRRFIGLGTVPLQSPDLAVKELERCMKDLNFAGIQIGSHINQWNLSDENLFPFFRKAEELGAALFVHPWDMVGQERMSKYWLPWLVGMPAEGALAIASMIFGGVFERLPGLRVAFAHGGGAFPGTIGRLEHGFQARPDLCAIDNDKPPISYAGKFWVDSLVHDPRTLRYVIEILGEDKIALGTDYPFPLGELKAGEMIESMEDLSAGTREKLLWRNAIDWLGVSPAKHGLPEGDAHKDALASSTRTGDKK